MDITLEEASYIVEQQLRINFDLFYLSNNF